MKRCIEGRRVLQEEGLDRRDSLAMEVREVQVEHSSLVARSERWVIEAGILRKTRRNVFEVGLHISTTGDQLRVPIESQYREEVTL